MKKDIHPTTYASKATCNSCNTAFTVSSTLESFNVEVCSQCHPFYTGEQRIMDTAGRADRFMKRVEKSASLTPKKKEVKKAAAPVEATIETTEEVATEA